MIYGGKSCVFTPNPMARPAFPPAIFFLQEPPIPGPKYTSWGAGIRSVSVLMRKPAHSISGMWGRTRMNRIRTGDQRASMSSIEQKPLAISAGPSCSRTTSRIANTTLQPSNQDQARTRRNLSTCLRTTRVRGNFRQPSLLGCSIRQVHRLNIHFLGAVVVPPVLARSIARRPIQNPRANYQVNTTIAFSFMNGCGTGSSR